MACCLLCHTVRISAITSGGTGKGGTGTHEVGVDARVDAGDPAHEVILLAFHVRRELGALDGSEHAQHARRGPAVS